MKRILIANRSEIARRIIRTAHRMGIETVAVYSDSDAGALHVREATLSCALGGILPAESYLRIDRLIAAAKTSGADAIHPGYGFLSEDANFAQAVLDASLIWIGPPPQAMRSLGSKSAAKVLAAQLGVPSLQGYGGADQSLECFQREAQSIGFPLMVKAVAGGGGRGMRRVETAAELQASLTSARSEALAGFGNGDLLIERALRDARHVEVQVFADTHGACIHLGERDCSVQRRHQKIIEESPSPGVTPELRERLGKCAVAFAKAAGYVGAGTVEFLLEDNQFYLSEMNTRLQVEHPVTEALTGLDLVEWQIRVARGEALPLAQLEIQFSGHAIEVRLCAEDDHFHPQAGTLMHFAAPHCAEFTAQGVQGPVRLDHALESGLQVTTYFDSLLGKLIVHATDREAAIHQLTQALDQIELLGLPSNRSFLRACLNHPVFRDGQARISFLADHADALRASLIEQERALLQVCAMTAIFEFSANTAGLAFPYPRPIRIRHRAQLNEWSAHCPQFHRLPDGQIECQWGGGVHRLRIVHLGKRRWHVQSGGVDCWLEDASYEPSGVSAALQAADLRAPYNGRMGKVAVTVGQTLAAHEPALVLESMKLEHSLSSPVAVQVAEVLVSSGQQVQPGQVLLRFAAPLAGQ